MAEHLSASTASQVVRDRVREAMAEVDPSVEITSTTTFAQLGATSLNAALVLARVWRSTGVRLELTALEPGTSVEDLTEMVVENSRDA